MINKELRVGVMLGPGVTSGHMGEEGVNGVKSHPKWCYVNYE